MIINENILKKYLFPLPNNLKDLVNNHIIEVESTDLINPNQELIIGEIVQFEKIPQTTKLNLVQVNIGKEVLSIVCGASNLAVNKKVVVIQSGSYLDAIKTTIEKKTVYGVESNGMICSAEEIGLNLKYLTDQENAEEGILLLGDDAQVGQSALEYLQLKGSFVELALTPNKAELLSHIGFVKDLAAMSTPEQPLKFIAPSYEPIQEEQEVNPFQVKINNDHCWEYNLRYLTDVKVTTSPLWLRNILNTSHIKPVNNVVDIMNLVMIEYGIPIVAFDASDLKKPTIEINQALSGQKVVDSEKNEYLLNEEDIVITNDKKVISVAGMINAAEYNINDQTLEIILSTAFFRTENVFQTSKRLNIQNENALRFKRGIDQALLKEALDKATSLLQKLTSVKVNQKMVSSHLKTRQNPVLTFSLEKINKKTGINFSSPEVIDILTKLDYQIKTSENNIFQVVGPSRRYDAEIYEDVISDLIRIRGYNDMDASEQSQYKTIGLRTNRQQGLYKLRNLLANLGFMEVKTYSLLNETLFKMFSDSQEYVSVIKPISKEKTILRQNLAANMIEVLSFNQKNNNLNNAFFEIGKAYYADREIMHLSLGLSGLFFNSSWLKQDIESSFFVLKGVLERIQLFLNIDLKLVKTKEYVNLHPGRQANIVLDNEKIGFIGEIHPNVNNAYHLKKSFLLNITLKDSFFDEPKSIVFQNINKFPSITRDLSFLINQNYTFEEVSLFLQQEVSDILVKCELLDLYQNKDLSTDEYSLSFRFTFKDAQQSLQKKNVEEIMTKIEDKLKKSFKVQIR
ncbi:MAG: phenylalanine--tRNA ligase subunit beta [Lettuce witches'-broom phytoplasma]